MKEALDATPSSIKITAVLLFTLFFSRYFKLSLGLAVVFMASSVIISSIFRSTRSDKRRLPVRIVNGNASITDKRDIPAPEFESNESNSKPTDI